MTILSLPTERRVVLDSISWSLYQKMLAAVGDSHVRLTFDQGRLEILSPSYRHEAVKTVLAQLIESYADVMGIAVEGWVR